MILSGSYTKPSRSVSNSGGLIFATFGRKDARMTLSGSYTEPPGYMQDPGGLIFATFGRKVAHMTLSIYEPLGIPHGAIWLHVVSRILDGSFLQLSAEKIQIRPSRDPTRTIWLHVGSWRAHFCNFRPKSCTHDSLGILHGAIWLHVGPWRGHFFNFRPKRCKYNYDMTLSGSFTEPPGSM
eukprot:6791435-Karenia_brevis.AAC.1